MCHKNSKSKIEGCFSLPAKPIVIKSWIYNLKVLVAWTMDPTVLMLSWPLAEVSAASSWDYSSFSSMKRLLLGRIIGSKCGVFLVGGT